MQMQLENINKWLLLRFTAIFIALLCVAGCATPAPNPLTGWSFCTGKERDILQISLSEDYHDYINKLPPKVRYYVQDYNIRFFKDGTNQHAVKIEIPLKGSYIQHVLFYDNQNKRVKVIVYSDGKYAS
jgi:hypothetical protein